MPLAKSPLSWITALTAVVAALIPVLHLSQPKAAAASVIAVAVGHGLSAWFNTPRHISVITGAAGVILAALAAYGLKLSPDVIAIVTAGLGVVLGHLVHAQTVTTTVAQAVPAQHVRPPVSDS